MFSTFSILCILSLTLQTALSEPATHQQYSPFAAPVARNAPIFLLKRQNNCPADHTSCASLNAPEACCPTNTNCARDQGGKIACCPVNNYCTGTLGGSSRSSNTLPSTGSSSIPTGFVGTVTVTSTAGVTGSETPSITGSVAGGGSAVPNAYYPFVYIPTSFPNAGVCSQYYTSCQSASTACFQSLAGINGVTIGGMGGGTTQAGNSGILQASASSICHSLSQNACYGLQSTRCSQLGTTGGVAVGAVQVGRAPRETSCPRMVYVAAAGAAVGAMGMVA